MKIGISDLLPISDKISGIFRGVVESNLDKEKRGRVKIRIFGIHTQEKDAKDTIGIPTDHLPWAEPACSIIEGAISGGGVWAVPPQGSHVFLFFENGNIMQPRYFAAAPGVPKSPANIKIGFNDPAGVYPKKTLLNEADWNRLARDNSTGTYVDLITDNLLKIGDIEEPRPYYKDSSNKYPNNIVFATQGGHIFEVDNTSNNKRFTYYHPSHTYIQIDNDGEVIFRNESDRYMLVMGDLYEYTKEDRTSYVVGDDHLEVAGNQEFIIAGTQDIISQDDQTIFSNKTQNVVAAGATTQNIFGKFVQNISAGIEQVVTGKKQTVAATGGGQNVVSSGGGQTFQSDGTQNNSVKGSRNTSIWGSNAESYKGMASKSIFGAASNQMAGMYTSKVYGPAMENSMTAKFVGSPQMTNLGFSPTGTAINTVSSVEAGVTGAIRNFVQPLYDIVNVVQTNVGELIADSIAYVNDILLPITSFVSYVNNSIAYVRMEYQNMQQLIQMGQQLPLSLVKAVMSEADKIMNIPGVVVNTTINNAIGSTSQINLVQQLNKLYSTANDFGLAENLIEYNEHIYNLNNYSMNDLDTYPRSSLAAYDGTNYTRKTSDDYHYDPNSILYNGSLSDEMVELTQYVSDALSAVYISPSGEYLWDDAIVYLYVQQEQYIRNWALSYSVNSLLYPLSLALPIDPDVFSEVCSGSDAPSGYFIDSDIVDQLTVYNTVCASAAITEYEIAGYTSFLDPPNICYQVPDYTNLSRTVPDLITNPPSGAGPYAMTYLLDCQNVRVPAYSVAISTIIRDQVLQIFGDLVGLEEEVKALLATLDWADIDWEGKYDDWEEFTESLGISAFDWDKYGAPL